MESRSLIVERLCVRELWVLRVDGLVGPKKWCVEKILSLFLPCRGLRWNYCILQKMESSFQSHCDGRVPVRLYATVPGHHHILPPSYLPLEAFSLPKWKDLQGNFKIVPLRTSGEYINVKVNPQLDKEWGEFLSQKMGEEVVGGFLSERVEKVWESREPENQGPGEWAFLFVRGFSSDVATNKQDPGPGSETMLI